MQYPGGQGRCNIRVARGAMQCRVARGDAMSGGQEAMVRRRSGPVPPAGAAPSLPVCSTSPARPPRNMNPPSGRRRSSNDAPSLLLQRHQCSIVVVSGRPMSGLGLGAQGRRSVRQPLTPQLQLQLQPSRMVRRPALVSRAGRWRRPARVSRMVDARQLAGRGGSRRADAGMMTARGIRWPPRPGKLTSDAWRGAGTRGRNETPKAHDRRIVSFKWPNELGACLGEPLQVGLR